MRTLRAIVIDRSRRAIRKTEIAMRFGIAEAR